MHDFHYQGRDLYCEGVPIEEIANEVGTPFYLYSYNTLLTHFRAVDSAFSEIPHLIAYSVKANSNLAILRIFAREGGGADVVSGGEIFRAVRAGIPPNRIVYTGVGKNRSEIHYALGQEILLFTIESEQELRVINEVALAMRKKARVALRVNPDIDPKTHPYIATGLKKNKFGISIRWAMEIYKLATSLRGIEIAGIHTHIGSQLVELRPFIDSLQKTLSLVDDLRGLGIRVEYIDIGGGLGITYDQEEPPHPKELAEAVTPLLKGTGSTLILEPGRVIVGNAGILVTRVLYTKEEGKNFIVVDAGMNDLIRPSLYDAFHKILAVTKDDRARKVVDVVGPICESGDFLAKDRELGECRPGELLAVMSAGAYGFSMASNYNSRPRAPEVLVSGDRFDIIREREEYTDLIRGERIPGFLSS